MLYPNGSPKILIVDDNPAARMIVRTMLMQFGDADIHEAASVEEAIDILTRDNLDIVILDMKMMPLNGADLQKWITCFNEKEQKNIRTIGMTVDVDGKIAKKAKEYGLDPILMKPLTSESLLNAVCDAWL